MSGVIGLGVFLAATIVVGALIYTVRRGERRARRDTIKDRQSEGGDYMPMPFPGSGRNSKHDPDDADGGSDGGGGDGGGGGD
jgi:hypothetical protein